MCKGRESADGIYTEDSVVMIPGGEGHKKWIWTLVTSYWWAYSADSVGEASHSSQLNPEMSIVPKVSFYPPRNPA